MAIESGREWIATVRKFSRFGGLRWRRPLEQRAAFRACDS